MVRWMCKEMGEPSGYLTWLESLRRHYSTQMTVHVISSDVFLQQIFISQKFPIPSHAASSSFQYPHAMVWKRIDLCPNEYEEKNFFLLLQREIKRWRELEGERNKSFWRHSGVIVHCVCRCMDSKECKKKRRWIATKYSKIIIIILMVSQINRSASNCSIYVFDKYVALWHIVYTLSRI